VDRAAPAIRLLRDRSRGMEIDAHIADLERGEFAIAPAAFDLICVFYYLQRDLFPAIREGLRPGGIFAGAVHLREAGRHSHFALESGALRAEFASWKILFYSEAPEPGHSRRSARIIARKA